MLKYEKNTIFQLRCSQVVYRQLPTTDHTSITLHSSAVCQLCFLRCLMAYNLVFRYWVCVCCFFYFSYLLYVLFSRLTPYSYILMNELSAHPASYRHANKVSRPNLSLLVNWCGRGDKHQEYITSKVVF